MLFRSLIKSSRTTKPAFVKPVTPLLARFITSSSNPSSRTSQRLTEGAYEKELDASSEPITTFSGTRSYVVNEPDPADSKYDIPTGAYHSTAPYEKLKEVTKERSSSNSEVATGRAPRREAGVGTSAAVRGKRGGGDGGLGLMDKEGTQEGVDWVLESGPPAGKA